MYLWAFLGWVRLPFAQSPAQRITWHNEAADLFGEAHLLLGIALFITVFAVILAF